MRNAKRSPKQSAWLQKLLMVGLVLLTLMAFPNRFDLDTEMRDAMQLMQQLPKPEMCVSNPYLSAREDWKDSNFQQYGGKLQREYKERAETEPILSFSHQRFRSFEETVKCHDPSCVGGACGADASKIVCGLAVLQTPRNENSKNCIVYSIGGNNMWQFELDVLKKTTCDVHTFDCTGDLGRFKVPIHERLHFHYECLHGGDGPKPNDRFFTLPELTAKYGHTQIDLLKMDIEGFEFGVLDGFEALRFEERHTLPMQIMMEIHFKYWALDGRKELEERTETQLVEIAEQLHRMGYAIASRDDNKFCTHCTELTLLRVYC